MIFPYKFVSSRLFMHVTTASDLASKYMHKNHPLHNATNKLNLHIHQYLKMYGTSITLLLSQSLQHKALKYKNLKMPTLPQPFSNDNYLWK